MIEIDNEVIKKLKEFDLFTDIEGATKLLSHYVPMDSKFYHSQKTPKKFKNTHLLQEAANKKMLTGRYCEHPFKSRLYNEWAIEEIRRCREGYTINEGTKYEISITGYHYFFLNYKMIKFEDEDSIKAQGRDWFFPKFMAVQYHFFWSYEESIQKRQNFIVLKPRGIGFSEMVASMACRNYVLYKDTTYLFAMQEDTLIKDGIYTKVTDNIDFLNAESDKLFLHSKITDKTTHKIAGVKYKTHNLRTGGEIIGRIIDTPRKARGSRGMLIGFEEAGSFKDLVKAFNTALASIKQTGGKQFGSIMVWGTGGDENTEYLEGLEQMFYKPSSFNAKVLKNKWSQQYYDVDCGWFAPTYYYSIDKEYTDKDGNIDTLKVFCSLMKDRFKDAKNSVDDKNINQRAEEYPITPEEALQKKGRSKFPIEELKGQMLYLTTNPEILRMWVNGWLRRESDGKLRFRPSMEASPLNDYPIKPDVTGKLKGCISIFQRPLTYPNNENVVMPIYSISVDPYSEDTSEYSESVGAVYVMKRYSKLCPKDILSGNIVAKYVGRMDSTREFARIVFELAEFYNTIGETHIERRGGGKILIDYAKEKPRLLQYVATTLGNNNNIKVRQATTYGNTFTDDENEVGLTLLREWLLKEVTVDEKNSNIKLRLHNLFDIGLIKELINFVEDRNYDRISAMRQLMFVLQEEDKEEEHAPVINPYKKLKTNEWFK